jgi:sarcosine oxidase, subunit beta
MGPRASGANGESNGSPEVLIIGAGVIGAAIALELARRGRRTLNVDRQPAAGAGPTSNSCAIIRAHYSSHDGVAMAYESFFYWDSWAEYLELDGAGPDIARYHRRGSVLIADGNGHLERSLTHFDEIGVPYERWDEDRLARYLPGANLGRLWPPCPVDDPAFRQAPSEDLGGAIFTPGSGYVSDPQLASQNLQQAAERLGARFRFRSSVTAIESRGDQVTGVVIDGEERVEAPVVINVAGPHSDLVNRMAGVTEGMNIRTHPLRHEVHIVKAPEGFDAERNGAHVSDADSGIYFRPETGDNILVGSEDPVCDDREWVEDPDDFDRGVTQKQWERQVFRLARRLPTLGIPNQRRGVVDLYDVSDDWIPIYDRSDLGGYYMAIGTSGNQFKNAPVVGRLMAELVEACESGHDHDADPGHIRALHTGLDLDLGFYSRRREINDGSSFSVSG